MRELNKGERAVENVGKNRAVKKLQLRWVSSECTYTTPHIVQKASFGWGKNVMITPYSRILKQDTFAMSVSSPTGMHIRIVSCIIRGLDTVLLYQQECTFGWCRLS